MFLFALAFALLLNLGCDGIYVCQPTRDAYDYIIVGAGSSGSVLASRLSEDAGTSVLLLEAGGRPTSHTEVPIYAADMLGDPDFVWKHFIEPQENAFLEQRGQKIFYPRGRGVGGSSLINFMVYIRGNRRDYDRWQELGADGWNWESVKPYFLKSQNQTDPKYTSDVDHHAQGGYLTVSSNSFATPLADAYLEAVRTLGHRIVDVNGESQLGFYPSQLTVRDGLRCSVEKAFLRPTERRDNLDILTHAYVTRINLDESRRVRSVQFEHQNHSRSVSVRKEVVLSAGALSTPKILMLSGIGPRQHLEDMGIPVVADLPVGQNLQDHLAAPSFNYILNSSVSIVNSRDIDHKAIGDLLSGKGPLTVPVKIQVIGFANSKYQDKTNEWPDLQYCFLAGGYNTQGKEYEEKDLTTAVVMLMRPKSRGVVKLRSLDPHDHPFIDPNFLSDQDDVKVLAEGVKFLDQVYGTPELQKYNPVRIPERTECDSEQPESDEYWACVARTYNTVTFHPSGTCRMGSKDDPSAVIDPELRVKNVQGLRVADASIMPRVVTGNTNAACIMIGEKAADIIRGIV